jgi:hypothetical protein
MVQGPEGSGWGGGEFVDFFKNERDDWRIFFCFLQRWPHEFSFSITQIANPQILGLIQPSQIRKFNRCASLPIANLQFFLLIHKLQTLTIPRRDSLLITNPQTFHHKIERKNDIFLTVLRIRNKSFGSCLGSGSGLKLVSDPDPVSDPGSNPDSNPDSNPGFESGSESWIRIQIRNWQKNFYAASSSRLPSISSVTCLRTKCAKNLRSTWGSHTFCICILSVYSVPTPRRWT